MRARAGGSSVVSASDPGAGRCLTGMGSKHLFNGGGLSSANQLKSLTPAVGDEGEALAPAVVGGLGSGALGSAGLPGLGVGGTGAAVTAGIDRAASIGAMTVPQNWAAAAPGDQLMPPRRCQSPAWALPEAPRAGQEQCWAGYPWRVSPGAG